ncbi:hypothetical protein PybrP1_012145 [[Pythium] brassicae (nom. inval.)]|nr:hypothetical protein PybrP1_012145 [[Pythium] brassicae (nom. inval.)]
MLQFVPSARLAGSRNWTTPSVELLRSILPRYGDNHALDFLTISPQRHGDMIKWRHARWGESCEASAERDSSSRAREQAPCCSTCADRADRAKTPANAGGGEHAATVFDSAQHSRRRRSRALYPSARRYAGGGETRTSGEDGR